MPEFDLELGRRGHMVRESNTFGAYSEPFRLDPNIHC